MRISLPVAIYIIVGVLVAAGIIGSNGNYFSGMNTIEEVLNMLLAVILWPLVLLGVDFNIGGNGGSASQNAAGGSTGGK